MSKWKNMCSEMEIQLHTIKCEGKKNTCSLQFSDQTTLERKGEAQYLYCQVEKLSLPLHVKS